MRSRCLPSGSRYAGRSRAAAAARIQIQKWNETANLNNKLVGSFIKRVAHQRLELIPMGLC